MMNRSNASSENLVSQRESHGPESTVSISIKPKYHDLLRDFGDPVELANYAIESYLVTKILKYIEECKVEIKKYEDKYGCAYQQFYDRIIDLNGKDSSFVEKLEKENPIYEDDFISWGAFHRELQNWNKEMENISKNVSLTSTHTRGKN